MPVRSAVRSARTLWGLRLLMARPPAAPSAPRKHSPAPLQRVRPAPRSLLPEARAGDAWRPVGALVHFGGKHVGARLSGAGAALKGLGLRQGIARRSSAPGGESALRLPGPSGILPALAAVERLQPPGAVPQALRRRRFRHGGAWATREGADVAACTAELHRIGRIRAANRGRFVAATAGSTALNALHAPPAAVIRALRLKLGETGEK